jgi:hypothetical protein
MTTALRAVATGFVASADLVNEIQDVVQRLAAVGLTDPEIAADLAELYPTVESLAVQTTPVRIDIYPRRWEAGLP